MELIKSKYGNLWSFYTERINSCIEAYAVPPVCISGWPALCSCWQRRSFKVILMASLKAFWESMFCLVRWTQTKIVAKKINKKFPSPWKFNTHPLNNLAWIEPENKIKKNGWRTEMSGLAIDPRFTLIHSVTDD